MQSVKANLRVASSSESELETALRELNMLSASDMAAAAEKLSMACSAAQYSLGGIAPGDRALPWSKYVRALRVDDQLHACFARVEQILVSAGSGAHAMPDELMRRSAQLFGELSAIYACDVVEPDDTTGIMDGYRDPALRHARALLCAAASARWTHFMRVQSDRSFWRAIHKVYERCETLNLDTQGTTPYHHGERGTADCAGIYAHVLLMDMLNSGSLAAPQIALAQQWLSRFITDAKLVTDPGRCIHPFHVDLAGEQGLQVGEPPPVPSASLRYLDIAPIHDRLIESRERLRHGTLDIEHDFMRIPVLDYGTFLDIAERIWSPEFVKLRSRAARTREEPHNYDIVSGLDALVWAIATGKPINAAGCNLHDRSESGIGLVMQETGLAPGVGAIVGFAAANSTFYEIGVLVRTLTQTDVNQQLLGIRTITDNPIVVMLRPWKPAKTGAPASEYPAIYAPLDGKRNRADSLILDDATYKLGKNFILTAGDATYHLRLNRVLERGSGWVRAGYQVLSRKK